MTKSIYDFIEKYGLNKFEPLEFSDIDEQIEFITDFNEIFKNICRIFDMLTTIAAGNCIRGGSVLMALAKRKGSDLFTNKADVRRCLDVQSHGQVKHAFDYLECLNLIKVTKKTDKLHIVELNEIDHPILTLFREIIQDNWTSPEETKNQIIEWGVRK